MSNVYEITINAKQATFADFTTSNNQMVIDQLYFLRSERTGKFDEAVYKTDHDTNSKELGNLINRGMVYIPANFL